MATSSSMVHHDVFITISSKDTRYSFVSHLSAAFRRSKISVFVGDASEEADAVAATEAAIEGSKVFVVVFSKNYEFSRLSLDTLVKIMERKQNDDVSVVPIAYGGVTWTDVKRQMKRFGEASSDRSLYSDKIAKWQKCQIETARLSGHDSSCQPVDSELVKEVVADVREKLTPTNLVGFYSRYVEIENLLWKQSKGVCRLGIWGMPGIGKTTIAQAAFDLLSPEFEVPCFLKDFHTSFHEKGSNKLREDHRYKVPKGQKGRVLVVLDDVRNPRDAESFLGEFSRFGPGSVIIITSRDKQVLSQCQCQVEDIYTVPGLNQREALQLFIRSAFRGRHPSESNLQELSHKLIEHANGNPKAICIYGNELKKKRKEQMEEAFHKIKGCPPMEIMDLFKSSYDALSDTERSIFLDIACFFKGERRDHVMRILEGCAFFPHVGVDRLAELSLLTISERDRVEMHSLVQEVGREIAIRETKLISRRRRLWEPSDIKLLLEDKESKGKVIEGIFLDATNIKIVVSPMAFKNMYKLRLLKIFSSSSEAGQELHLPKELRSLPYELRLLHWEKYPLRSLPQDFDPQHLVELNMPYSQLQNLWRGTKLLVKLKIIILSHSQQLVEVDELSEACSLERIDLQGCSSLESIPHTDQLKNLQLLNLSGCTRIKRAEIKKKIKGMDLEGGLKEMVFSTLEVKREPGDSSKTC